MSATEKHAEHHSDHNSDHSSQQSLTQIQAELDSARADFVASLQELRANTTPQALVQRGVRAAGSWFTDEFGGVRPERVAIVGAVVVGFVALKIIRRRGR